MMKKPLIQWVKLLALATSLSATASVVQAGCYKDSPELLRYKAREYQRVIDVASATYQVDPNLINAVITAESCFQPRALSPKGARGLMQLMPATARRFGVSDRSNPTQNIHAGTRYLRWLLDRYNGSVYHAVAAYNSGEGTVDRHGLNVPYQETQTYVRRVVSTYKRLHASPAPNAAQQAVLMRQQAIRMRQIALRQQAFDRQKAALDRVIALRQAAFRQPTVSLRQAALLDAAQQEVTIQQVTEAEVAQADPRVAQGIVEADDNPVVVDEQPALTRKQAARERRQEARERRLTSRTPERRLVSSVVEKRQLPSCKSASRQLHKATIHSDSKGERSFYYTVKRGDNIEKITHLTGVSVAMIKGYNDMTRSLIRPGQKLKVSECRLKK